MTDFTAVNTEVQKLIDAAVKIVQDAFDAYKASHPDTAPPPSFVWPDASNTGVPSSITLTSYSGPSNITVDGTVLDSKLIIGSLTVSAKNVTIKNCKFTTANRVPIFVLGTNCTIDHCTLAGTGTSTNGYGIDASETTGVKISFCNISGYENGCIVGTNAVVKNNFIHKLQGAGADPHYDGVVIGGDSVGQTNILIEDNTILGRDNADVWISNDFGSISNVTVNHNKLLVESLSNMSGPNATAPVFTMYVDGRKPNGTISNITITNNIIQKGFYDWMSIDGPVSTTISGNVKFEDGSPING